MINEIVAESRARPRRTVESLVDDAAQPDASNLAARGRFRPGESATEKMPLLGDDAGYPDAVRKQFVQAAAEKGKGDAFYFRDRDNVVAFVVESNRLRTEHSDATVAKAMVDVAASQGWASISLSGDDRFKREAWMQASLAGLDVQGHKPSALDTARLAELREARQKNVVRAATAQVANDARALGITPLSEPRLAAHVRAVAKRKGFTSESDLAALQKAALDREVDMAARGKRPVAKGYVPKESTVAARVPVDREQKKRNLDRHR